MIDTLHDHHVEQVVDNRNVVARSLVLERDDKILRQENQFAHGTVSEVEWESGAIAWVAQRNTTPLLILRGVSDLVSLEKGEAQGNEALFVENAKRVMQGLTRDLSKWMRALR